MVVPPTVAARHNAMRGAHDARVCHIHWSRRPRPFDLRLRLRPDDRGGDARVVPLRPLGRRRVGALLRRAEGGLRVRRDGVPPLPRASGARARLRRGRGVQDAEAQRRPPAQDRPARRRVPGEAARHPQRGRGGRPRRGVRGRPRPLPRARGRPRGPAARQARTRSGGSRTPSDRSSARSPRRRGGRGGSRAWTRSGA